MWVGVSAALNSAVYAAPAQLQRYRYSQIQMGVPMELVLYAADEPTANKGAQAAYERIKELNSVLSDYDPQSELSRLSDSAGQGRAVPVGPDLWLVLSRSQLLAARTGGAFDVTVGPYVKLWRRARRSKEFPPADRLAEARAAVGYRHLHLDPQNHAATLENPGMRLDLGGIAMGYACDEALRVLRELGITRTLIDASGDILVGDAPPGAAGWKIGIAPLDAKDGPPSRFVLVTNAAVTTAGDAAQFVEIGGRRYSHIVDPHTGLGLSTHSSVTVIAPDCLTADALDTAANVLGPTEGLKLIEQTPGAAAFIVEMVDGRQRTYESSRLDRFLSGRE
jgi:thiamine biosynthesis lipoprotein